MSYFYIKVYSGLNNKLIPLLSLLRIAKKENKIIKCYWGNDAYINKNIFSFTDLFKPINNIIFITEEEYNKEFTNSNNVIYNKDGSDRNRNEIIYKYNEQTSVFNKIVHLISYETDNVINNFVPYPKDTIQEMQIISELRNVLQELIPTDSITQKIQNTIQEFENKKILGIHLRTTDGGFKDIPKHEIYPYIFNLINKNVYDKIYVSCDNFKLENDIISIFKDKIIVFKTPFGNNYQDKFNRFSFGTLNAVCEMFILSKCTHFIGTPGSSFSFMVWLLRNDKFLQFWCKNPWF